MGKRRDPEGRERINENISRHVDAIALGLSAEQIFKITVKYWMGVAERKNNLKVIGNKKI